MLSGSILTLLLLTFGCVTARYVGDYQGSSERNADGNDDDGQNEADRGRYLSEYLKRCSDNSKSSRFRYNCMEESEGGRDFRFRNYDQVENQVEQSNKGHDYDSTEQHRNRNQHNGQQSSSYQESSQQMKDNKYDERYTNRNQNDGKYGMNQYSGRREDNSRNDRVYGQDNKGRYEDSDELDLHRLDGNGNQYTGSYGSKSRNNGMYGNGNRYNGISRDGNQNSDRYTGRNRFDNSWRYESKGTNGNVYDNTRYTNQNEYSFGKGSDDAEEIGQYGNSGNNNFNQWQYKSKDAGRHYEYNSQPSDDTQRMEKSKWEYKNYDGRRRGQAADEQYDDNWA